MKDRISETQLDILIQNYEAIGSGRSINQNQILSALQELKKLRESYSNLVYQYTDSVMVNNGL